MRLRFYELGWHFSFVNYKHIINEPFNNEISILSKSSCMLYRLDSGTKKQLDFQEVVDLIKGTGFFLKFLKVDFFFYDLQSYIYITKFPALAYILKNIVNALQEKVYGGIYIAYKCIFFFFRFLLQIITVCRHLVN